jgi:ParD-like antitoxin of type II bacterial toxin-antitoxin system
MGGAMATVSLRIDKDLALQAEREARIQNRSKAKQLEYWAKIGKAISSKLSIADVFAVSQGIKTIKLEVPPSAQTIPVRSDDVFNDVESDRSKGLLAEKVTAAKIYFEVSIEHPGYIDRVDAITKKRQAGLFENGKFKAL